MTRDYGWHLARTKLLWRYAHVHQMARRFRFQLKWKITRHFSCNRYRCNGKPDGNWMWLCCHFYALRRRCSNNSFQWSSTAKNLFRNFSWTVNAFLKVKHILCNQRFLSHKLGRLINVSSKAIRLHLSFRQLSGQTAIIVQALLFSHCSQLRMASFVACLFKVQLHPVLTQIKWHRCSDFSVYVDK